jgi:heme-degrading monooxygenase HmoA
MRITVVYPKAGREGHVNKLLHEMGEFMAKQPGYIEGYSLKSHAGAAAVARVSMWESAEALDKAAMQTHSVALRSQLFADPFTQHQELLLDVIEEYPKR